MKLATFFKSNRPKTPRVKSKFVVMDIAKKDQSRLIQHGWLEKFVFYKYSNRTIALSYQVGWNEGSHSGGAGNTVEIPDEWFKLTWDEFLDNFCEQYPKNDFSYSREELDNMPELKRFLGF